MHRAPRLPGVVLRARSYALLALIGGLAFAGLARPGPASPRDGLSRHAVVTGDVMPAVGRLNYAEMRHRRYCTAFLSGPRRVTTAGHCVNDLLPSTVHVLPGYDGSMHFLEHLKPGRTVTLFEGRDISHLCLPDPAATAPLTPAPRNPVVGEKVVVFHYAVPAVHRQQRAECSVVARLKTNEFVIDCKLGSGASGAPVVRVGLDGKAEVIGVVSKAGRGYAVAEPLLASDLSACEDGSDRDLSLTTDVR